MQPTFVDSSVLLIAFGADSSRRDACRELVGQAAAGARELHVSVESLQEFLFHRLRVSDRSTALEQASHLTAMCVAHRFDDAVWVETLALVGSTSLRGRDAVIAATARGAGFMEIVSLDHDFDGIPGLIRVEPETAVARTR